MNNRGSVLVFVLIFIAFCSSAVIFFYEKSMKNIEQTADDFYENQSNVYAMSAMTALTEVLSDDDNPYDSKSDDWAVIPPTTVPYGTVTVKVLPAAMRIDLNAMGGTDETMAEKIFEACENIFEEKNIRSITCAEIKDYVDTDETTSTGGKEGNAYEKNGVTLHTKNSGLDTVKELGLIFPDADEYVSVRNFFTATVKPEPLNINFADAETIKMFLPEIADYADKIASVTDTGEFSDVSAVKDETGMSDELYTKILPFITVKSSLFYAKTEVTLNGESRFYHALLSRNGISVKVIRFLAGQDGQYY